MALRLDAPPLRHSWLEVGQSELCRLDVVGVCCSLGRVLDVCGVVAILGVVSL